eukprot:2907473-Heterocapsa_arctica.AAC.1
MEVITRIIRDFSAIVAGNGGCNHSGSTMRMDAPLGGKAIRIAEEGNDITIYRPSDGEPSAFQWVSLINTHPLLNIIGVINDTGTVSKFNGTKACDRKGD